MPLRMVSFESRRNEEMSRLIEKNGGQAVIAPALQEIALSDQHEIFLFGKRLMAGEIHGVIFMTGSGTDRLWDILSTRYSAESLLSAFSKLRLVARGPKPLDALRRRGFETVLSTDDPATSEHLLALMDKQGPLQGKTIAIQEYGSSNQDLLDGLSERGARVFRLPVYRWTLPTDTEPLRHALHTVIGGEADIVLFTNSNQIQQVLRFAQEEGLEKEFRDALSKTVVASVGPVCTEYLDEYGVPVDLQPEQPTMANLVNDASLKGPGLLERKRRGGALPPPEMKINDTTLDLDYGRARGPAPTSYPLLSISPFLKACRREKTPFTPIWLMRQAGRYMKEYQDIRDRHSFLDLCKDSDLATEVTVYAVERLGVDAAIIFSDILVLVEPMGLMLDYKKGDGPVIGNPIRLAADVSRLTSVHDGQGLEFVYDAIAKTRRSLPSHIPLIGFAGAPFTLASYMIEGQGSRNFVHTKSMMYTAPEAWQRLMAKITQSLIGYLNAQIAAGAQAIQLFDSWVGCLSPRDYKTFVLPYTRQVIQAIKPQAPVIYFGTDTAVFLESMTETGCDVLGVDWRIDLDQAWSRVGPHIAIQGNLDPAILFADLPEIRRQAQRILDQAAGRPGHIFNLGHGVLPNTPVGHVKALVDMVHELSNRSLK